MIQVVEQPYFLPRPEVEKQFEGRMVLLAYNSENTESGLIVAYSDGNKDTKNEDRNNLFKILRQQYDNRGKIITGYVYDGSNFVCI
jgi:hypothetical protein